jgi:D-lactate dehydrogenase
VIHTGCRAPKSSSGYDLTGLFVGSEGTLAVITEATLKLVPLPGARRTLQAIYADVRSAARAISAIMAQPVIPSALEFMDGRALQMVRDYSDPGLPSSAGALLMIELEENEAALESASESLISAARVEGCLEVTAAINEAQVQQLWRTRKALSPALRKVAPKKINEDVVVPVSHIPDLVNGLEELARQHQIAIVNFGHAGNGNIHVNLLIDPDDPRQAAAAEACLDAVFDLVLRLGGTLSGEHGIGLVKRRFVDREVDAPTLELMRAIKQQFDPAGILNPGKTLP